MPVISRGQISPDIRGPHEARYKAQLRRSLSNPTLTDDQHWALRLEIRTVGRPKVYSKDAPPKPGAISFGPSAAQLRELTKAVLIKMARSSGVAVRGTKEDIIGRLARSARRR